MSNYTEENYSTDVFSGLVGREITALRSECEKHYDLGKGRRQAIQYAEPVHYRNNGKWDEINNQLILDEKAGVYRTSANAYSIELAAKDDGRNTVSFVRKDVAFGWTYAGKPTGIKPSIKTGKQLHKENYTGEETEQDKRLILCDKLYSEATYKDIRPGMDTVIFIDGRGIKEDIILNTPEAAEYAAIILPEGFEYCHGFIF